MANDPTNTALIEGTARAELRAEAFREAVDAAKHKIRARQSGEMIPGSEIERGILMKQDDKAKLVETLTAVIRTPNYSQSTGLYAVALGLVLLGESIERAAMIRIGRDFPKD